tara:strand:- start:522 stop:956 length:435 start_codon:yes stop_codon:yes gene_type:complete
MRQNFRPYSITSYSDSITPSGITLTDSAGTPLKCNYVSVESSGQGGDGLFSVTLSSIQVSATQAPGTGIAKPVPAAALQGITSGLIGGTAPDNKGVVEFVLSDADRVDTLYISQSTTGPTRYFINYGEVQHGNDLRDNLRAKGD